MSEDGWWKPMVAIWILGAILMIGAITMPRPDWTSERVDMSDVPWQSGYDENGNYWSLFYEEYQVKIKMQNDELYG